MEPVYIAGIHEHPTRSAPEKSTLQLVADVTHGALTDAGLSKSDVDGLFSALDPEYGHQLTPLVLADYLGLDVRYADSTDVGGAAYVSHVGHAANAIRAGKSDVALITHGGRALSRPSLKRPQRTVQDSFESIYGATTLNSYALAARRHMDEYGTTSEQLAEIRVAAASHAQHNPHARYRTPLTIEDVVNSEVVADPLHLLDCCVVTDGAGAVIMVSEEVRSELDRDCVEVLGHGESVGHHDAGRIDLTRTAATTSGKEAFQEAGVCHDEIDYASIYDSFTITALLALEDLGFCEKGHGGEFVAGGTLQSPDGGLPFNTDGGGLSSNHPGNRGGITKVIEAVRQLRRETAPEVQVRTPRHAIVHGTGGNIATRHGAVTVILGAEDR